MNSPSPIIATGSLARPRSASAAPSATGSIEPTAPDAVAVDVTGAGPVIENTARRLAAKVAHRDHEVLVLDGLP